MRILDWLIKRLSPKSERDFLLGDFEEIYENILKEQGRAAAQRWYRRQCFQSLPRIMLHFLTWRISLLKNYIKAALRNLNRQKGYSFINIIGLTIGIAAALTIFLFISYEKSYDRFHEHANRIYRLNTRIVFGGREVVEAVTAPAVAPALIAECPEIEKAARFFKAHNPFTIHAKDKTFSEKRFFFVDPEFFEVFFFPLIKGDPKTALSQPYSVVLTQTTAKRYFPTEDPVGKILTVNNGRTSTDYIVSGVSVDVPDNSHFTYDFLARFADHQLSRVDNWFLRAGRTYVLLRKEASAAAIEARFPPLIKRGAAATFGGEENFKQWLAEGNKMEIFLQPMLDIHLQSRGIGAQIEPNGDIVYVRLFSFTAFFILLIAVFNFINLATARSAKRANEIGVRKVMGASRFQLVAQFLSESVLMSFHGFIFAIGLVFLFTPAVENLINKKLNTPLLLNWHILPLFLLCTIMIGILAGAYPALYLSTFKPVQILRGKLDLTRRNLLRNGLVIFQFTLSILMIVVTLYVDGQLKFISTKDLGLDKNQIAALSSSPSVQDKFNTFLTELEENPKILKVSSTGYWPGRPIIGEDFGPVDSPPEKRIGLNLIAGDENLMDTFGLKIISGRFFSREIAADDQALVINETAARKMTEFFDWNSPLDKKLTTGRETYTIIGVVKDFHFESLHSQIRPMALIKIPTGSGPILALKINSQDYKQATSSLKKTWDKYADGQPFELTSFRDETEKLYESEQRTARMMGVFSLLAVVLGCLGLFGLAAFSAEQKTKEIGIRKVFGASQKGLVMMFLKQFLRWVVIANILAWPAALYIILRWRENFAYRADIAPSIFILSGAIVLILACLTVVGQAHKASVANPVETLKYE